MTETTRRSREFKAFRFRRRYDHFLRSRLAGAKPDEIIKVARDLGFELNLKDLHKRKPLKTLPSKRILFFNRLRNILHL